MTVPASHPIVVFGDDWGRHVSTMQHVFRHIVPHRRVFWVNAIGHRLPTLSLADLSRAGDKIRRALNRRVPHPTLESEAVTPEAIIDPRVLPWHHWGAVHRYNTWSLTRAIRQSLEEHGATLSPVLVTGSPPSTGVLGRLGEIASIYFCMDDFLHHPDATAKMIAPLENRLLGEVDMLVATAQRLTEIKVPDSGQVTYLPQGVNYDHFAAPRSVPDDIVDLPRPIIGFAGGVSSCCDYPLLQKMARAWPEASIVLVGPVHVDEAMLVSLQLPNVHFLGARPYEELPAYVQAFDVGLIPYILNEWTMAVDPLKLLEYLAAGIPVVTTDIPEVRKYDDVVAVAATHDAFQEAVRSALAHGSPDAMNKRQRLAQSHTWDRRAEQFLEIMDRLITQSETAMVSHG